MFRSERGGAKKEKWEEGLDIHKILETIHREEKDSPHLEISDRAAERLGELMERCRGEERKIVAIIRCWGKSEEDLREVMVRLEKMEKYLPELKGVIFAIDADQGPTDETENNLNAVIGREKSTISVVPLKINNYSWTAGFNGPVALLSQSAKEQEIPEENIFIFPLSFDVEFEKKDLQMLAERFRKTGFVMTAKRTGEEFLDKKQSKDLAHLTTDLISHPEKLIEDEEEIKKVVTLARNTATIVPLSEVSHIGGYDNSTNEIGGMEDHDLYLRILIDALHKGKILEKADNFSPEEKRKIIEARAKVKTLLESMRNLVGYSDLAWEELGKDARQKKIKRELSALKIISQRIAALTGVGDSEKYKTPVENRDFNF
jgi:hypothetical protein